MKLKLISAIGLAALLAACADDQANQGAATGSGDMSGQQQVATGPAPGTEADLVANVGDRVFFGLNQSGLSSDAKTTLDKQADWLAKYPQVAVQLAGNCDDRGTEEFNLALGQRRANAARDYLVAKGTASSRITTISNGKDQPTAAGEGEDVWAQNRNAITSVQ
ncbi:OmpA family protein [Acetobacter sp. AN02]|uniref:OmpA family protein n=1 Tax=Acetobacter sp. AN02 TaxID=2894186 RepID=UPI00243454A2|nr:OmpA family protein [Acetobacter sp. AN02]MDG6094550.1 OmpA family protein [Acetobacter sp. AN02]